MSARGYTNWAHGNSINSESPQNNTAFTPIGWGCDVTVKANSGGWFHLSIPTPDSINGSDGVNAKYFYFLFNAPAGGMLQHIHIYDAGTKVYQFNNVNKTGDQSGAKNSNNTFIIPNGHNVNLSMAISAYLTTAGSTSDVKFTVTCGGALFVPLPI